jgi:hypothetical protein
MGQWNKTLLVGIEISNSLILRMDSCRWRPKSCSPARVDSGIKRRRQLKMICKNEKKIRI